MDNQTRDYTTGIKKLAVELQAKTSWIRAGAEKLMENWESISECGEEIISDVTLHRDNEHYAPVNYRLVTGGRLLHGSNDCDDTVVYCEYWDLPIKVVRKIITRLPDAMTEIAKKMEETNKNSQNIIDFLKNKKCV